MPRRVGVPHHLRDLAVRGTDHVVGAHLRGRVLEPADRARVRALGDVDDDRADRLGAPGVVVAGGGRNPERGRVVRARGAEVASAAAVLVRALVRGDAAAGDGHLLALGHRGDAPGEELVDGVRVEGGGGSLGVAVAGDGRVPGVDVASFGAVEAQRVGVRAQYGGAALDVRRGVAAQLGGGTAGDLGGLVQGVVDGVADQMHDAVSEVLARFAVVAVEMGLAVADRGQQVPGDVVLLRRLREGGVHRGVVPRRRGGGLESGRGQGDGDGGGQYRHTESGCCR